MFWHTIHAKKWIMYPFKTTTEVTVHMNSKFRNNLPKCRKISIYVFIFCISFLYVQGVLQFFLHKLHVPEWTSSGRGCRVMHHQKSGHMLFRYLQTTLEPAVTAYKHGQMHKTQACAKAKAKSSAYSSTILMLFCCSLTYAYAWSRLICGTSCVFQACID